MCKLAGIEPYVVEQNNIVLYVSYSKICIIVYVVRSEIHVNFVLEYLYYINTSEIPSELSRENFISSHVKITCYLHT